MRWSLPKEKVMTDEQKEAQEREDYFHDIRKKGRRAFFTLDKLPDLLKVYDEKELDLCKVGSEGRSKLDMSAARQVQLSGGKVVFVSYGTHFDRSRTEIDEDRKSIEIVERGCYCYFEHKYHDLLK
jgi:hypothetical protein